MEMGTKQRRTIFASVLIVLLVQLTFLALRTILHGSSHFIVARAHLLVNQQLVMALGSYFIWAILSPAVNSISDCTYLRSSRDRWRIICLQDVFKALLCLFLALTHVCFLFYFFWVGDEPNLLALLSLISVAIYLHMIIFLIATACIHALGRFLLKFGFFATFLRWMLVYELVHRLIAVAMAVLVVLAGVWVAHSPPSVHLVEIPLHNLPQSQIGFTLALITDVHIGPTVGRTRVQQIVDLTNTLRPNVIAIAGDLTDGFVAHLSNAADPLRQFRAKYGIFFSTGNHEYLRGDVVEWFEYLRAIGIHPLHNEHVNIKLSDSTICVAGVDDLYAKRSQFDGHGMDYKKALDGCERNATVVMLAHQPNAVSIMLDDPAAANTIDLVLSGHTHAGQMYIFVPVVYVLNAFVRGLYYDANSHTYVYVSAGVNYFGPPVKMFGMCEIVLLQLVRKH
ncbi:unnamed protein product [Toxocara canis]|uniref:Putative metallophosphoesterase F40B5.2 n=1 Tax=Toxocara canis TaxID=6265 RepID=A0A183V8X8_TOXCA|nr:unnamed protein product [Toxocara canis]